MQAGTLAVRAASTTAFPRGLKPLPEYVRPKGVKFGLWS